MQGLTYYLIVYWIYFFRDLPLSAPFEIFGMIFLSMCVLGGHPRMGYVRGRNNVLCTPGPCSLLNPMQKKVSGGKKSIQVRWWCM